MKWLKAIFAGIPHWDENSVRRRLLPLSFREVTEDDFPLCENLHVQNEPHGIPTNHRPLYSEHLRARAALTLTAENSDQIVGTCGICWGGESLAWLCYGMVRPEFHRTGIGTTMFIARLSLLPTDMPDQTIAISALESSLPFYRRFGFRLVGRFDDPDGNRYPIAVLENVHSRMIADCRKMLVEAGACVPNFTEKIPLAKVQPAPLVQSV